MSKIEKTLSIIKPDAVERNLTEEIKNIFKKNNFSIPNSKKIHITKDEALNFIKFINLNHFTTIYEYLSSGPIVVMIPEGIQCCNS